MSNNSSIELFINDRRVDLDNAFSIRLNRMILSPNALNVSNAQNSFSISLPITFNNREIFEFSDIEEKIGKFAKTYNAELLAAGVLIFKGKFLLSEITQTHFKGNLYLPKIKELSEIFGDKMLSELPPYTIEFLDFVPSINIYNELAKQTPQVAIFPYVLYGLLPKQEPYTERNVWDDSVVLGKEDFYPSMNVLKLLDHIFKSHGLTLKGKALKDERLKQLYMSYTNPPDLPSAWNYGYSCDIKLRGSWSSCKGSGAFYKDFEVGCYTSQNDGYNIYSCNLFNSTRANIEVLTDKGHNVLQTESIEGIHTWKNLQVRIPATGYYKIRLRAGVYIPENRNYKAEAYGIKHIGGRSDNSNNYFPFRIQEIRLLRDRNTTDFNLQTAKLNSTYYRNNQNQNTIFNADNAPKYFPRVTGSGAMNMIDLEQDNKMIVGFGFGGYPHDNKTENVYFTNPADDAQETALQSPKNAQIQVAKPTLSFDETNENRVAVNSKAFGYKKWSGDNTWSNSDKYEIELKNVNDFAVRGAYNGQVCNKQQGGTGEVHAVVWLEAGELITLASVASEGRWRKNYNSSEFGWVNHSIVFELDIKAFRIEKDWLKIDADGKGTAPMNWNDSVTFANSNIDLTNFLPTEIDVNTFVDNFIKMFNLSLTLESDKVYSLDTKKAPAYTFNDYVDLDEYATVKERVNRPVELPKFYEFGFKINEEEEGYLSTNKTDGGGVYHTTNEAGGEISHINEFSYCWYKQIVKVQGAEQIAIELPIISKSDVWNPYAPYDEAMIKNYTDLNLRFWYFNGLFSDDGVIIKINNQNAKIAKVSNTLAGKCTLDYSNSNISILNNYFDLMLNTSNHYTEIEVILPPLVYEKLNRVLNVIFNGDVYKVAEITGYDPSGRNKTKIKLLKYR